MNIKTNKNSNQILILIRPSCYIKSRQWWAKTTNRLRELIETVLPKPQYKWVKELSYSLVLTNNKEIQKLNKEFRNINKPTDVLSFYLKKKEQINQKYLGDIIISIKKAKEQSFDKNHPLEEELKMLLIHGYLHLIGYDHQVKKEAKIMFALQDKILKRL